MKYLMLLASLFLVAACTSSACRCGTPVTPSVGLQLGPQWKCVSGQFEVTCKPGAEAHTDRIIIYSMKQKGPQDSLDAYKAHLTEKIAHDGFASRPESYKVVEINGQRWVDAVQFESEARGYYTRYLATVDDEFAMLVTFSAARGAYEDFSREMQPVIDQLTIRR